MSRHILLLTDFSADAGRAFLPVAQLADLLGARITLLHVIETSMARQAGLLIAPLEADPSGTLAERERENDANRLLGDLASRFSRECVVTPTLMHGPDVAGAAAAFAEAHHVDMIAMASHGRTGLRRLMMGSVAEAMLRRSSVPVLVFPAGRAQPHRLREARSGVATKGVGAC